MGFTAQLIQLLSEPPGSFLYHLLALFALQVVFAISYGHLRRNPDDDLARRIAWSAGTIFTIRGVVFLASLFLAGDAQRFAAILPPVEDAVDSVTIALLLWSFIPRSVRWPKAADLTLLVLVLISGVLLLFALQTWQTALAAGEIDYRASTQAAIWSMFQIAMLSGGLAFLLIKDRRLGPLPPLMLAILLASHIATLWNYPAFIATESNVAYWNRLGYLIALPLWAAFAYQHVLTSVLDTSSEPAATEINAGDLYRSTAQLIATRQTSRRVALGLALAQEQFAAPFTAVGLLNVEEPDLLTFYSTIPLADGDTIRTWRMDLNENQGLRTAVAQGRTLELYAEGIGARQLHTIDQAAEPPLHGPLLVQPLGSGRQRLGLLLIAAPPDQTAWTATQKDKAAGLAEFLNLAILNSQAQTVTAIGGPSPDSPAPATVIPAAIVMDRERLRDLKHERDELRGALAEANAARQTAENSAAAAQKQARYLAAALRVAQAPPDERGTTNETQLEPDDE